jgi:protease-4
MQFPPVLRGLLFILPLLLTAGCGTPSFLITPVSSSSSLDETTVQSGRGFAPPKIALIELDGMLANARVGGLLQAEENKLSLFTQQLEKAESDDSVKAVVLRINSPGGTVTCSDTMYEMVKRFRAQTKKPVIADAQEVTASGAYYVACGCDRIVAHPTSVVGSIGVIFQTFEITGTMQKLGITSNAIASGPFKEMGSPFKQLQPDERALMQKMVDEYYARFVSVVTTNRHVDPANIKQVTDGRVFSGEQARELGLVDQVGLLDDAIDLARTMATAPDAQVVMYKRPYGYSGSIYSTDSIQPPRSDVMRVEIPVADNLLPTGFYYLWQPGIR